MDKKSTKEATLLSCFVLFLFSLILLLWSSWNVLAYSITPSGDLAADMLLGNRIKQEGFLFVGHYSRWHFNHPGPFWFYYNEVIERLLGWTHLSRYYLWTIGSIFINSIFILFSSIAISTYLIGNKNLFFSVTFIFIFIGLVGGDLVSLWMPDRLISPYLAFVICLLHLTQGNYKYLTVTILLANILIHGYVTMPVFTIPFLIIAIAVSFLYRGKLINRTLIKKQVIYSFCITAFFFAPVLFDFLFFNPSNFSKIFTAISGFTSMQKPSLQNMQTFINNLLFINRSIQWLVILPAILIITLEKPVYNEQKNRVLITYITCLVITLTVIFYYKSTPVPFYSYIAQFYIAIPVILISASLSIIFNPSYSKHTKLTEGAESSLLHRFAILMILIVIAIFTKKAGTLDSGVDVKYIANAMINKNKQTKMIAIDYSEYDLWPLIAGILLELNNNNIAACTTKKSMGHLYTQHEICPSNTLPVYYIVPSKECKNDCIINGYGIGVKLITSEKKRDSVY